MLAASPASLAAHKDDYVKIIKVWDHVVHYIADPKTQADAVKIMSKRVGLSPEEYLPLLKGTHLLDVAAGKKTFKKGDGLDSLYGSSKNSGRLQRRQRGLQGGAEDRYLYRPVVHRGGQIGGVLRSGVANDAIGKIVSGAETNFAARQAFARGHVVRAAGPVWSIVSYVPAVWHPQVLITDPGSVDYLQTGMRMDKSAFADAVKEAEDGHKDPPKGFASNPIYLPRAA